MKLKHIAGATIAAFALAAPALAEPIVIVQNTSGIAVLARATEGGTTDRKSYPYEELDPNAVTLIATAGSTVATGFASIASDVSNPYLLTGAGAGGGVYTTASGTGDVSGVSTFWVDFIAPTALAYDFDAAFVTGGEDRQSPSGYQSSRWQTSLSSATSFLFVASGSDTTAFARSGVLGPGFYRLVVDAGAAGQNFVPELTFVNTFASFGFSFALSELDEEQPAPTPEPATLLLLGTGIGGMIAARRRRQS